MRTLTLDLGALEVETFTARETPWLAYAAFAETDDAECDADDDDTDGCDSEKCYTYKCDTSLGCTQPPNCLDGEL